MQNKTHTRLSILTTAAKNVGDISVIRPAIPSSEVNVCLASNIGFQALNQPKTNRNPKYKTNPNPKANLTLNKTLKPNPKFRKPTLRNPSRVPFMNPDFDFIDSDYSDFQYKWNAKFDLSLVLS